MPPPPDPPVLCVTSFAADMLPTGLRLLRSFSPRSDLRLLVCHESLDPALLTSPVQPLFHDIAPSPMLQSWLRANADIIPRELGGTATPCHCPAASDFQGHRERCHWFWFNRNASRWFRKIVALDYAATLHSGTLLWLDADCRFTRRLNSSHIAAWMGAASVLCLKSPGREAIESGVLAIRMDAHGRKFLSLTADRFRSGAFRDSPRWDDGYQFQKTLADHPEIPFTDLATRVTGGSFVLPNSPLGRFISHDKGVHRRRAVMT